MSASQAGGAALNAAVVAEDSTTGRTEAQQAYLDAVADDAERAVETVEQMIADLQDSLADRRAEVQRARVEADNGRVS